MESPSRSQLASMLVAKKTMLLTTFRKSGDPVHTPVSVAVADGRVFFRSYAQTGKAKRLRRCPLVEVTPSTLLGKQRGVTLHAEARLLQGDDAAPARRALARRHPLLQGLLVPLLHKLRRYTTLHYEIEPREVLGDGPDRTWSVR
jgi:uncharacterized protein